MKPRFRTTRTLRVIAVALIGLTSLAVLGGCAVGGVTVTSATPMMTPASPIASSTPVAPSTPVVLPVYSPHLAGIAYNPTTNLFYVVDAFLNTVSVFDGATN